MDCTVSIPSVVRGTVADIKDKGLDLVARIPSKRTVERKLYRKRNNSLGVIKVCFDSIMDMIIPPKFKTFVFADYRQSPARILVFAGEYCREILRKPNLTVFCDGTFKFCLRPFQQLYTLHVDLGSDSHNTNIIPVLYALLPNKTKHIYKTLFRLIKTQIPEFEPNTFVLDFEKAAMLAIKSIFPSSTIQGCYFHFSRSLWRKADQLGLKKKTKAKLLKKHIKRCTILALLPREVINDAWLYIMSQCPRNEMIVKFNDYFVQTWLTETCFFADKWCVYNAQHRTTNMLESWHSIINKKINNKPNNVATFLTLLQKEDKYQQTSYLNCENTRKKSKYTIEFDEHLKATMTEFGQGQINLDLCIERLIL